ncbi:MAG: DUF3016 domain-containing protein [Burkholderiaceae bacterium]
MRILCIPALLLAAAAAQSSAFAAGTVNVQFVAAEKFTDIGWSARDREENLKVLEQHLHKLGQRYLADGQTLTIEITDVDLAGSLRPMRRSPNEVRVLRGTADWPVITLRYTLESGGQSPKRGEERVADMNYAGHMPNYASGDPLRYEKQMLDAWFKASFAAPQ